MFKTTEFSFLVSSFKSCHTADYHKTDGSFVNDNEMYLTDSEQDNKTEVVKMERVRYEGLKYQVAVG